MFKWTGKSGYRPGGSGSRVSARVNVRGALKHVVPFTPGPRRTAFLPDTPQESTFDSTTGRVGGLESNSGRSM